MPMPEASMDKDGNFPFGENNIWSARQARPSKRIAQASGMQMLADQDLWSSVAPLDTRHHPAACRSVNYISHANRLLHECGRADGGPKSLVHRVTAQRYQA